jgi:HD superfamily phosphohydrolase
MDFLSRPEAKKIVRTVLYEDQEFSLWELELLHSPAIQRLYDLKQLGFTDRVYPDAVHSRFNHVLGVAELAGRMIRQIHTWLLRNPDVHFDVATGVQNGNGSSDSRKISSQELAEHVQQRMKAARVIALLHDLTHVGFGHTLEDEISVLSEKHDSPSRQARFFDALIGQLLMQWRIELQICQPDPDVLDRLAHMEVDGKDTRAWAEEVMAAVSEDERRELVSCLKITDFAMRLLLHLEYLHGDEKQKPTQKLAITDIIESIPGAAPYDVDIHRDAFFLDIVGNTVCADLLDYARRDCRNAGVHVDFDQRLLRYLVVISVRDDLSPDRRPCIRSAVQFYTDKMRYDVLTEMSAILKARYIEHERILLHPTKCAAGAILGTAVQLLGVENLPVWAQSLGDQALLSNLARVAVTIATVCEQMLSGNTEGASSRIDGDTQDGRRHFDLIAQCMKNMGMTDAPEKSAIQAVLDRARAARLLLWHLSARNYPRLVYRLRSGVGHSGGQSDEELAAKYNNPSKRYALERALEGQLGLPMGSVLIHCPRRKTAMKVAAAIVVGRDLTQAARLRDVTTVTPEGLGPYQAEIRAVEEMYRSIWCLHVYLDKALFGRWKLLANRLAAPDNIGFPNDGLLMADLERSVDKTDLFYVLANNENALPLVDLPSIIMRIAAVRRLRQRPADPQSVVQDIIRQELGQRYGEGQQKNPQDREPRKRGVRQTTRGGSDI